MKQVEYYETWIDCSCGQRLGGTHIDRGYIFVCRNCGKNHWRGFRALMGVIFGPNTYNRLHGRPITKYLADNEQLI